VLASADTSDELSLFLDGADAGRAFPRVTIGRCHMDDSFVCLYNSAYVKDATLRFLV
jgi:hypothetical protein